MSIFSWFSTKKKAKAKANAKQQRINNIKRSSIGSSRIRTGRIRDDEGLDIVDVAIIASALSDSNDVESYDRTSSLHETTQEAQAQAEEAHQAVIDQIDRDSMQRSMSESVSHSQSSNDYESRSSSYSSGSSDYSSSSDSGGGGGCGGSDD